MPLVLDGVTACNRFASMLTSSNPPLLTPHPHSDLPMEVTKPLCAPNKATIVEEGTCVLECVLNKSNQSFAWYKNDTLIDMFKEKVGKVALVSSKVRNRTRLECRLIA